jgi:hypothetical protein
MPRLSEPVNGAPVELGKFSVASPRKMSVPCGISTLQLVIAGGTRLRVNTLLRTKFAWPNTPTQSLSS